MTMKKDNTENMSHNKKMEEGKHSHDEHCSSHGSHKDSNLSEADRAKGGKHSHSEKH